MTDQNINVLILCGGDGSEHNISIISSNYIKEQLKDIPNIKTYYVVIHNNSWLLDDKEKCFLSMNKQLCFGEEQINVDYVIPCIHGYPGETGDIQSYLEMIHIPYLGCNSESSKICFNKISTKLWFNAIDIPNTEFVFITSNSKENQKKAEEFFDKHQNVFIKAASQGSSVGCYKVDKKSDLAEKINEAFKYSNEVLIEKSVKPRELEIAAYEYKGELVITNPGEIITPSNNFYTFDEKYKSDSHSYTKIESDLDEKTLDTIKKYARKAFIDLKLKDLSRIDFFLLEDSTILLNEINTFPGMTQISMFPKMLEHHGEKMKEFLLDRIYSSLCI
jgi:D-alanine-D-alanine ligase